MIIGDREYRILIETRRNGSEDAFIEVKDIKGGSNWYRYPFPCSGNSLESCQRHLQGLWDTVVVDKKIVEFNPES